MSRRESLQFENLSPGFGRALADLELARLT